MFHTEFQVIYVGNPSSRRWSFTSFSLKCELCLVAWFQRVEYGKEQRGNFTMNKLIRSCLRFYGEIRLISCTRDMIQWECHFTFAIFIPKIHSPNLTIRKTSEKPKLSGICKIFEQYASKPSAKTRNFWETVRDQRRIRKNKVMWYPGWVPRAGKGH